MKTCLKACGSLPVDDGVVEAVLIQADALVPPKVATSLDADNSHGSAVWRPLPQTVNTNGLDSEPAHPYLVLSLLTQINLTLMVVLVVFRGAA